jgi:hypothetical protein
MSQRSKEAHRFARQLLRNHGHAVRRVGRHHLRRYWDLWRSLDGSPHQAALYDLLTWRSEAESLRAISEELGSRLHSSARDLSTLKCGSRDG